MRDYLRLLLDHPVSACLVPTEDIRGKTVEKGCGLPELEAGTEPMVHHGGVVTAVAATRLRAARASALLSQRLGGAASLRGTVARRRRGSR